jgi:hypothetical protein
MSDRTILSPANANSLNGLFNGSTPINVASVNVGVSPSNVVLSANAPGSLLVGGGITTSAGLTAQNSTLTLGVSPAATVVSSNGAGSLLVSGNITSTGTMTAQTGTLTLGVSPAAVVLTGTSGNVAVAGSITTNGSTINGTCTATAFRGGIIFHLIQGLNPGTLAPSSGYTFPSMLIPNFVGTASSAYLISCNNDAGVPYLPVVFTITYASNDGTNTYVNIGIMNVSTTTSYGALFDVSIIAMN